MDTFRPRSRLPLDPFQQHRTWSIPPPSELTHSSPPQVILILGDAQSSLLPLLTSPRLSTCLVILATHDPNKALLHDPSITPYTPGPSIRILQLSAPLDVHDAGALRLISVLNRAGRVADDWRRSRESSNERTILHLVPDSPDGDFCIVKPLHTQPPPPSLERSASKSSKRFWGPKSSEIVVKNNYPQYYYLSPSRAPRLPSAIDATHEYSRYPPPRSSSSPFVPHSSQNRSNNSQQRTFDAILNFLPDNHAGSTVPEKALLKHAILVTTLSAQFLAGGPSCNGASGSCEDITAYHAQRHALSLYTPPSSSPSVSTITLPALPRPAFLLGNAKAKLKAPKSTRRATALDPGGKEEKQKRRFSAFVLSSTSTSTSGFPFSFVGGSTPISEVGESSSVVGSTASEASDKRKKRFSSFISGYGIGSTLAEFGGVDVGAADDADNVQVGTAKLRPLPSSTRMNTNMNAHIVHILPSSWSRAFEAIDASPSSSSSTSSGGEVPFPVPKGTSRLNPNNSTGVPTTSTSTSIQQRSVNKPQTASTQTRTQKPKLAQGIEQFLLGFAESSSGSVGSPSAMLAAAQSQRRPGPVPVPTHSHSPSSSTSTSASTSSSSTSSSSARPSLSFSSSSGSTSTSANTSRTTTPGTTPPASRPASTYGVGALLGAGLSTLDGNGKGKGKAIEDGASARQAQGPKSAYRHSYHAGVSGGMPSKTKTRWSLDDGSPPLPSPSSAPSLGSGLSAPSQVVPRAVADKGIPPRVVPYLIPHSEFARALGCGVCAWVDGVDDDDIVGEVPAVEVEGDGKSEGQRKSEENIRIRIDIDLSSITITPYQNAPLVKPLSTGEAILLGLLDSSPSHQYSHQERAWIARGDVSLASAQTQDGAAACCAHAVWKTRRDEVVEGLRARAREEERRRVWEEERKERVRVREAERVAKKEAERAEMEKAAKEKEERQREAEEKVNPDDVVLSTTTITAEEVEVEVVNAEADVDAVETKTVEIEKDVVVGAKDCLEDEQHQEDEEDVNDIQQLPTPPESRSGCEGEGEGVFEEEEAETVEQDGEMGNEEEEVDVPVGSTAAAVEAQKENEVDVEVHVQEEGKEEEEKVPVPVSPVVEVVLVPLPLPPAATVIVTANDDAETQTKQKQDERTTSIPTPPSTSSSSSSSRSISRPSSMILAIQLAAELDAEAAQVEAQGGGEVEVDAEVADPVAVSVSVSTAEVGNEFEDEGIPAPSPDTTPIVVEPTVPIPTQIETPQAKRKMGMGMNVFSKIQRSLSSRSGASSSTSASISTPTPVGSPALSSSAADEGSPAAAVVVGGDESKISFGRNGSGKKQNAMKRKWNLGLLGLTRTGSGSERLRGVGVEVEG